MINPQPYNCIATHPSNYSPYPQTRTLLHAVSQSSHTPQGQRAATNMTQTPTSSAFCADPQQYISSREYALRRENIYTGTIQGPKVEPARDLNLRALTDLALSGEILCEGHMTSTLFGGTMVPNI